MIIGMILEWLQIGLKEEVGVEVVATVERAGVVEDEGEDEGGNISCWVNSVSSSVLIIVVYIEKCVVICIKAEPLLLTDSDCR